MKHLELFSGYGTATFALKRLGLHSECIGYSDIDKWANLCFRQNHFYTKSTGPGTLGMYTPDELGNVKEVDPNKLEDFDLLTGGFPCQAFSVAGKGLGELDPRGTLFYEIIRIAEVKKPRWMLLENVKGLVSKKHKPTFDKILSELERIGYHVHWKVLNTKDYGIPQNRERVWFACFREQSDFDKFKFPEKEELKIFIKDILEDEPVDKRFYLTEKQVGHLLEAIKKRRKTTEDDVMNCVGTCFGRVGSSSEELEMFRRVNKAIRSGGRNSTDLKHSWDIVSVQWDTSGKGYKSQQDRAYDANGVMCCLPNAHPDNKVNIFKIDKPLTIDANGNPTPNVPEVGEADRIYDIQGDTPCIKESRVNICQLNKHWLRTGKYGNGIKEDVSFTLDSSSGNDLLMVQLPHGTNPGHIKEIEVCPSISKSSWEHNNLVSQ
jgi:DNA (cytosine-5)-methyltransferase 1